MELSAGEEQAGGAVELYCPPVVATRSLMIGIKMENCWNGSLLPHE